MPLFICSCGAVDNSALAEFWNRQDDPRCSECATGTWHGRFPKEPWDGTMKVKNPPTGDVCKRCGNGPIKIGEECSCGRVHVT